MENIDGFSHLCFLFHIKITVMKTLHALFSTFGGECSSVAKLKQGIVFFIIGGLAATQNLILIDLHNGN